MEDNKSVQVNLDATAIEALAGKPLVVETHNTEHNAPTLNEKVLFKKHVTVPSIDEWIQKRKFADAVQDNKAVITFCLNANNPSIRFDEDPNDELATVFTSKLKVNPDFAAFRINSDEFFSQQELLQLIIKRAHCFASLNDAKDLRTKLQNFVVKYEQTIESKNDNQGNTKDLIETAIKQHEGAINGELSLSMPIFLGMQKHSFTVEIEIQRGNGNRPVFGFFSLDVEMLKREAAEIAILNEVEKWKKDFVCLEIEE